MKLNQLLLKKTPKKQKSGQDSFTGEFYQAFKGELTPILVKLFQNIKEEGMLLNSFYKASITVIPKTDKDFHKKRKV